MQKSKCANQQHRGHTEKCQRDMCCSERFYNSIKCEQLATSKLITVTEKISFKSSSIYLTLQTFHHKFNRKIYKNANTYHSGQSR